MAHALNMYNDEYIKFAYEGENYIVEIQQDDEPWNPRTDCDGNIVQMICWHPRHCLGDKHSYASPNEFLDHLMKLYNADIDENDMDDMTIAEKVAEIQTNPDIVMMPLYIYDHSGIALHVGAPGDGCDHWDTSMIGWAVIEKKDVLKIGITEDHWNAEFIEKAIRNEVEVYRQYLEGEAVGYTLYEENDDDEPEEIESCWGFFGYDVMRNGIADSILGLCEAIEKDEFATGKVRKETFVRKSFV